MSGTKRKPGRPPGSKNKNTKANAKGKPSSRSTSSRSTASRSTASRTARAKEEKAKVNERVKDEIVAILIIAVGAFLVIAFHTQLAGAIGTAMTDVFKGLFGFAAYILPYYFIVYGVLLFAKKTIPKF